MKKLNLVLVAVGVLGLVSTGNVQVAHADSDGWYAAGGFLAGLATAAIVADASRPRYYCYKPVYVRPVPVVYNRPVYRYYPRRCYSYYNSPYSTTTVYEREVVRTW